MTAITLAELASITGGKLHGDADAVVTMVAPMDRAMEGHVTFLSNPKYAKHLGECLSLIHI